MKEETNHTIFLRPRFSFDVQGKATETVEKIARFFKETDKKYKSKVVDEHIFIDVPDKEAHFWSPQLHIEVLEKSENETTVKGLFGPKPQVWTLFMFLHFIVGGAFITFIAMLYIRYSLGESLAFPVIMCVTLPIVWILLYVIGRLGRDAGKKQMIALHDVLLSALSLH